VRILLLLCCAMVAMLCRSQDFATTNFPAGTSPTYLAAGDIDGDGDTDVVAVGDAATNNVHVLLNNGSGGFGAPTTMSAGDRCYGVGLADFNGDGRLDIAVANFATNSISIFLQSASGGTFQAPSSISGGMGGSPRGLAVADFNADGKADFAVNDTGLDHVRVYIGIGDGTFQAAVTYATGTDPIAIAAADIDGDNKVDILTPNFSSDTVTVLVGTGTGTFTTGTPLGTGTNPSALALGDLNADGKPDVIVTNSGTNNISVFLNSGAAAFAPGVTHGVGSDPRGVAIADFDLDGKQDVAVANFNDNNVTVRRGTGTGGLQAGVNTAVSTSPNAILARTLNAGSAADLVTANTGGNNITVLLNRPDAASLQVTAPGATIGVQFSFAVSARDALGGIVSNFAQTVHFSSSDPQAVLPADYTFVAGDAGTKTFNATLSTLGAHTITATTTSAPLLTGTANIAVSPPYTAPVISSAAATPNPARAGQAVQFTCAASDEDGQTLTYSWRFGDGATDTSATPSHTYAAAGKFTATVTVSDGVTSVEASTQIIVGTASDLDGDGFSDAMELAAGTSISNPSSTPTGQAFLSSSLDVKKLMVKLNFAKAASDSILLQATLPPVGLQPLEGKVMLVEVGGIGRKFTLGQKGSLKSDTEFAQLKASKTKPLSVMVKLNKQDFAETLAAAGLVDADTTATVSLPVTVIFDNLAYSTTVTVGYKAKAGKTSIAK